MIPVIWKKKNYFGKEIVKIGLKYNLDSKISSQKPKNEKCLEFSEMDSI